MRTISSVTGETTQMDYRSWLDNYLTTRLTKGAFINDVT